MNLFYQQKLSYYLTRISLLSVLGYNTVRENSITLATQNQVFRSSTLFQSNCIHRRNEQVKQATCFDFPVMITSKTRGPGFGD